MATKSCYAIMQSNISLNYFLFKYVMYEIAVNRYQLLLLDGISSLYPICYKNICIPSATIITVATKHNSFTIWAKHRKCIEAFVTTNLLHSTSIHIYQVHVEGKPPFIFMITTKYNTTIGRKIRCPICLDDYKNEAICRQLYCSHIYHDQCIEGWLARP